MSVPIRAGPVAVEMIEIETSAAAVGRLGRGRSTSIPEIGVVAGNIMIDELPEIGKRGWEGERSVPRWNSGFTIILRVCIPHRLSQGAHHFDFEGRINRSKQPRISIARCGGLGAEHAPACLIDRKASKRKPRLPTGKSRLTSFSPALITMASDALARQSSTRGKPTSLWGGRSACSRYEASDVLSAR